MKTDIFKTNVGRAQTVAILWPSGRFRRRRESSKNRIGSELDEAIFWARCVAFLRFQQFTRAYAPFWRFAPQIW